MRPLLKRITVLALGWFFVLLGIIGLFLPILQGILFILIGLIILSTEYVWAHRLLEKLQARYPTISRKATEASARAYHWLQRFGRNKPPSRVD
jgi:uncharacterized membrane protein YbaN (DUF454 family)